MTTAALDFATTSALAASAVGFILGFITGTLVRANWEGRRSRMQLLAVILMVLAIFTVGQGLYFQHRQTQCNRDFLALIRDRADLADADRENLAGLVERVTGSTGREESRAALRDYLEQKNRIDATRGDHPLPNPEKLCR